MERTVGRGVVAIYFLQDECCLSVPGTDPAAPDVKALVRRALEQEGQDPWPEMEVELFGGDGRVLIIARRAEWHTFCFAFRRLGELLEAARLCRDGLPSNLTYLRGEWLLFVRCGSDDVPRALFEFAELRDGSDDYRFHAAEHGRQVIAHMAVDALKKF